MSRLALTLLGPPRIELDKKSVQISRRKVVALLAYLAVTGTPHSRDALATLLWPERSQSRARAYLRRALSELNRALGEGVLTIDRETAMLAPGADHSAGFAQHPERSARTGRVLWLDVDVFRQLLAAGEAHDHPTADLCSDCFSTLTEAVELYHDDFMAGFTLRDSPDFDEWQFFQREALRDELARALERLACWHGVQEEYDRAIAYARRWLALDPLQEAVHRRLMVLYAGSGQRNAALRQYSECERLLQQELGVPPEEETTELYQTLRVSETPRVSPPRHNLPVQATPFVGRESELDEIAALLQDPDCRLLTLIAPGGSGKTRLALEAAEARLGDFEHGVFFVSLAPLQPTDAIVPAVAEALGFRFYQGETPKDQLFSYLRAKHLLLIMDNYEHLLAPPGTGQTAGSQLVTEILKTSTGVTILATSRERLNVGGEDRFPVHGLTYPRSAAGMPPEDALGHSAVKLFAQSAQRAQPGFELTEGNLGDVVRCCHVVEGLPMGVRLAAAWVDMLPLAEIAAQISKNLDLLATERRDVTQRHRSVRAAFDHSWHLLSDRERTAMQALSVFRGSFSREAAQAVSGATLGELRALVDKSLVQSVPRSEAQTGQPLPMGRYDLHELLRQYGAEKLAATPANDVAARNHHSAYYSSSMGQWAEEMKGPRSVAALTEIDREIQNVRAAWYWAVERGKAQHLDRAIEGLCFYYDVRRRWEDGVAACLSASERFAGEMSDETLRFRTRLLAYPKLAFNGSRNRVG